MKRSLTIALALQIAMMAMVLVAPLIVRSTGTRVYVETRRVDPRALFRGDYVRLGYPVGDAVPLDLAKSAFEDGKPIYVTITTDRPAEYVAASLERPVLQSGQACLTARADRRVQWDWEWDRGTGVVQFPQIAQYFVTEGEGKELEKNLEDMVAVVSTTFRCNAVIADLELL